jgi:hypothetical protein
LFSEKIVQLERCTLQNPHVDYIGCFFSIMIKKKCNTKPYTLAYPLLNKILNISNLELVNFLLIINYLTFRYKTFTEYQMITKYKDLTFLFSDPIREIFLKLF